jgi:hypothetical protein
MSNKRVLLAIATVALTSIGAGSFSSVYAQDKATDAKAKWESLTPEEREKLKAEFKDKAKEKWEAMTPEEREAAKAKFKEKARDRWNKATPEQKEKIKERMKERREQRKNGGN